MRLHRFILSAVTHKAVALLCALLVLVPTICWSDELVRCASGLVSTEISTADLSSRCGEPSSRSVSTQDLLNEYGVKVGTLTTEVWRYDGDARTPAMTVTVVDGKVQSIQQDK